MGDLSFGDPSTLCTPSERQSLARRLADNTAQLTTASLTAMEQRLSWFFDVDAEHRSWITLVARAGIDGFVQWVAGDDEHFDPAGVFYAAPRALTRMISLQQTVELMRVTIDVVEEQVDKIMDARDREILRPAALVYSREVAFGAAEVYARAAETRGAWDARLEALVVDAIVRAETDETVISRASALGWSNAGKVCVAVGMAPATQQSSSHPEVRRHAERLGLDTLVAHQGERLVLVLGGQPVTDDAAAIALVRELAVLFATGPIVVGPVVEHLADASSSVRAAVSGLRAATAWPEGPRILSSDDLLPERVLSGDGHARRRVVVEVYRPLSESGGDLLQTCIAFLDNGGSVEATARSLFVHANTVRYRIKRILDVTGYNAAAARDAYVLRLALTLGRLGAQR